NPVHGKGIDQLIAEEQTGHALWGQSIETVHPSDQAWPVEPRGQILTLQLLHHWAPFDQDITEARGEIILNSMEGRETIAGQQAFTSTHFNNRERIGTTQYFVH